MLRNNESHSWWTPIDKVTFWKGGEWVKFETKLPNSTTLRIHYDQLLITVDYTILETFNMNSRLRGIYKGDVLILIASTHGNDIRKLKFQIKNNSALCFEKLSKHFPVTSHNSSHKKDDRLVYRNIEEIFQKALEEKGSTGYNLPPNFAEFVKLCLLDPTFTSIVEETQKIIQSLKP